MDAWRDQRLPNTHWGDIALAGGRHRVVVEYYEHGGKASAHVWWDLRQTFSGWEGRYYDNVRLSGAPVLIRDDALIDFDWGEGGPVDWMAADSFSVVWTRHIDFTPGYYRFNVRSDDGVRVWLDERLLMDYWQPQDYLWHYVGGTYLEGIHTLKVEYFERAGGARIRFWWEPSSVAPSSSVPTPAPVASPAPSAQPAASACPGGPLRLDAWPVGRTCTGGGWTAKVFVEGHGGDCRYTYSWESQVQGGPVAGPMTFELRSASRGIAIVGEAAVTSAGQTAVVGLRIRPPEDCR